LCGADDRTLDSASITFGALDVATASNFDSNATGFAGVDDVINNDADAVVVTGSIGARSNCVDA